MKYSMKSIFQKITNDVLISIQENPEYLNSGYKKISKGLFFYKYLLPLIYLLIDIIVILGIENRSFMGININSSFYYVILCFFILITIINTAIYLRLYLHFKTVYYNDKYVLVIDGYNNVISALTYSQITGTDYMCVNRGFARYGSIIYQNENKTVNIFFAVNRKTENELYKIDEYIKQTKQFNRIATKSNS